MFKEVTPEEADKLAEAGLLWYSYPTYEAGKPCVWDPAGRGDFSPSNMQFRYNDYTFYILTEE